MRNLLVTGANGQLGYFVKALVPSAMAVTRTELDLSSSESIKKFFSEHGRFAAILNLAAYTQVDLAETQRDMAWQVNAVAPAELGAYCDRIIHLSTDYVFGGEKTSPYTENDQVHPLGYYGESKQAGEVRLLQSHPHAIVIRTSWLYSELPGNFLTKITAYARQKPELAIVSDQRGTPTYAGDLAEVLVQIAQKGAAPGIYHYSNEGETTWCEFAQFFLREQSLQTPVRAIATSEYPTPAKRPIYSVLDKTKIKRELNIQIAPWQESVKKCLAKIS